MRRKLPRVTASLQIKGDRFYIVARIPDGTGKTHQKWFSTGLEVKGNKRRAQRMLDEKVIELQAEYERCYRQAGWSVQDVADVPFVDVVDRWMARKRKTLAPSTVNGYMNIIARLRPYFQHLNLTTGEISPPVLDAYLEHLTDAGLSANTVAHHLTLIKSVFNDEIRTGAPLLNPARCVKPPKLEPYEAAAYSVEQVHALFRLFEGDPLEDIVHIAVIYGLRRSEILGLRWQDVDFEAGMLHIRHKVAEVKLDGVVQLVRTNDLKTEASRRSFPLSDDIRARLERRRAQVAQWATRPGYCTADATYIFVREDGRLMPPSYITDHFRQKMARSGLPKLRFHDLRHTCATLLLHEGCTLREIQSYLGHATYITTTRYAHVDARSKERALGIMAEALSQNRSNNL